MTDLYDPALHQDDGHGGCVICMFFVPHTDDDYVRQQWPCAIAREARQPSGLREALERIRDMEPAGRGRLSSLESDMKAEARAALAAAHSSAVEED